MIATLKRLFLGSLRRQMVTGMVLTVALMMSAFVWDLTQRQQQVVLEQQSRQAVGIARSVAVTGSVWLASRDVAGLQEIVLGLSNYPDLSYAMVLDTHGQVLAHSEPVRRGQFITDLPATAELQVRQRGAHLVDVFSPVLLNARPIGWVRVGLAGTALESRLAQVTRGGVVYLLVAVILVAIFSTIVSLLLTRRLAAISRVASAVESGQAGVHVEVSGNDEAAQLARQFNNMLDALAQRDRALKDSESFKTAILDSVAAEIAVIDGSGVIVAVNEQWRRFALDNSNLPGQPAPHTDVGANYLKACGLDDSRGSLGAALAHDGIQAVLDGRSTHFSLDYPCHSPDQQRWFSMIARPLGADIRSGVAITHTDISAIKLAERYEQFRSQMLELMAGDTALPDLLRAMASGVEQLHPAMLCSILMLSDDGRHLGEVIAPSLPDFYNQALVGLEIGMGRGSCGTAAFTGERVVVDDIATHPYWADYKALAQRAGLGACWSQPVLSSTGQVLGTFALYHRHVHAPSAQDIAMIEQSARLASIAIEHKRTQAALRASEDMFRTLFETSPTGVLYQNADGYITSANAAAQRILGLTLDQLQGRTSTDPRWRAIREDGSDFPGEQHPISIARKTGQPVRNVMMGISVPGRDYIWILVSAVPLFKDGQLDQAYVMFEDVTERHQMEQQVRQLAFYDPLTQLPNRRLLTERLDQAIAASKRSGGYGAMMFLDLDNFKPLNDQLGHEVGDLLLVEVAQRLKNSVRGVDTVARLGGDEFVVMLTDLHVGATESIEQASSVAEKIRTSLALPYLLTFKQADGVSRTVEHHCTASIGITLFSGQDASHEQILQRADAAMYQAKDAGRNRVQFAAAD
jgi:diguanylate cyclase (GGDEF)-like protein/PAS domain S-box-containing protein